MLILISGLPGSGKTFFSEAFAKKIGAYHINSDVIRGKLSLRGKYDKATKEKVYHQMLSETKKALSQNDFVIVDATFYLERIRQLYLEIARTLNQTVRIIEIKASPETIRDRISKKRKHSEAKFPVYLQIKKEYEPILQTHLTLWSDQISIEEMIEKAIDFIQLKNEREASQSNN